jgi:hypothetical protein
VIQAKTRLAHDRPEAADGPVLAPQGKQAAAGAGHQIPGAGQSPHLKNGAFLYCGLGPGTHMRAAFHPSFAGALTPCVDVSRVSPILRTQINLGMRNRVQSTFELPQKCSILQGF